MTWTSNFLISDHLLYCMTATYMCHMCITVCQIGPTIFVDLYYRISSSKTHIQNSEILYGFRLNGYFYVVVSKSTVIIKCGDINSPCYCSIDVNVPDFKSSSAMLDKPQMN